jgi:hypothetical protein
MLLVSGAINNKLSVYLFFNKLKRKQCVIHLFIYIYKRKKKHGEHAGPFFYEPTPGLLFFLKLFLFDAFLVPGLRKKLIPSSLF